MEFARHFHREQGGTAKDDAIFFAYGWSALWRKPHEYSAGQPGIGPEVAWWIVERKPAMVGSDSPGLEVTPNPDRILVFPVHQELITKSGIWN